MAYTDYQRERIDNIFRDKSQSVEGKTFMGGYCYFLNEKMCVGLDIDKNTGRDRLMARIGEKAMTSALEKQGCTIMDITGRPMKGFVFIDQEGFERDSDLEYWIQLAIDFNPFAKKSKKKIASHAIKHYLNGLKKRETHKIKN